MTSMLARSQSPFSTAAKRGRNSTVVDGFNHYIMCSRFRRAQNRRFAGQPAFRFVKSPRSERIGGETGFFPVELREIGPTDRYRDVEMEFPYIAFPTRSKPRPRRSGWSALFRVPRHLLWRLSPFLDSLPKLPRLRRPPASHRVVGFFLNDEHSTPSTGSAHSGRES